jgi:hypothetical protein
MDLDRLFKLNGQNGEHVTEESTEQKVDKNNISNTNNNLETEDNEQQVEKKPRGRPKKTTQEQETSTENKTNKEQQEANTDNTQQQEEQDVNPLYELTQYIKTKNKWEDFEVDEVKDLDDFADKINNYVNIKKRSDIKDELLNVMIDYIESGGNSLDFVEAINSDNISLNINLKSDDDKIKFLYRYYSETTNWDDEKIKNYINKMFKANLVNDEVETATEYYINKKTDTIRELVTRQKEYKKKLEEDYQNNFNRYIDIIYNKTDEVFEEKIDKKIKDQFSSFLFEKKEDGLTIYQKMILENPELELKIAYNLFKTYINNSDEAIKKNMLISKIKNQILQVNNNKTNNNNNTNNNISLQEKLNKIFNNK